MAKFAQFRRFCQVWHFLSHLLPILDIFSKYSKLFSWSCQTWRKLPNLVNFYVTKIVIFTKIGNSCRKNILKFVQKLAKNIKFWQNLPRLSIFPAKISKFRRKSGWNVNFLDNVFYKGVIAFIFLISYSTFLNLLIKTNFFGLISE